MFRRPFVLPLRPPAKMPSKPKRSIPPSTPSPVRNCLHRRARDNRKSRWSASAIRDATGTMWPQIRRYTLPKPKSGRAAKPVSIKARLHNRPSENHLRPWCAPPPRNLWANHPTRPVRLWPQTDTPTARKSPSAATAKPSTADRAAKRQTRCTRATP